MKPGGRLMRSEGQCKVAEQFLARELEKLIRICTIRLLGNSLLARCIFKISYTRWQYQDAIQNLVSLTQGRPRRAYGSKIGVSMLDCGSENWVAQKLHPHRSPLCSLSCEDELQHRTLCSADWLMSQLNKAFSEILV